MGGMGSRGGSMYNNSNKRRHYSKLLLLALGAAMLSVLVLHKLREGRVLGLLLQDRERQLLTLQMILEKERAHSEEMKTKIEELKAKAGSLRSQKMHLRNRLMEAENLAAYLKNEREELESALEEKQKKLASLKDKEEASIKANLPVAAPTDLPKPQQDHTEETERHLQQPSSQPLNATPVDDVPKANETDGNTGKEEIAGSRDDGAKEVENSEHEQGSNGAEWVRLETNTDDSDSTEDQDQRKEEVSEQQGELLQEGVQVGNQSAVVEVTHDNPINPTELLLLNTTTDGQIPVTKGDVTSSNATETDVRPEDGQLEKGGTSDGGEEKQTTDRAGTSIRGRRSRRTRTRGRKRRAAVRSREQNTDAPKDSQTGNSPRDESTDNQASGRNATETGSEVEPKLPEDHQTASEEAGVVDQKNQTDAVSLEASAGLDGDKTSEAKSSSTEIYQDTNGSEEKSTVDSKDGFDSGDGGEVSGDKESTLEGGIEATEENNTRSTMEANEERPNQSLHGTEEDESSGKEAEEERQPASVLLREGEKTDEEKETSVSTSTESIQQEEASATEIEGGGEMNEDSRVEQGTEAENSTEEESGDENEAEPAADGKSEHEEAKEDEGSKQGAEEF